MESKLKILSAVFGLTLMLLGAAAPVQAKELKIGVIAPFSGPYANWGKEYQRAIDLYLEQHNGKDGNPTVSVITRDTGGVNPSRARQLAQELITRDQVVALGGEMFSPNLLAVADVISETKTPFVIFNGATSSITDTSPYFVRPTFTMWSFIYPFAQWAVNKQGYKKGAILVAGFAAGDDAVEAFTTGFKSAGGEIVSVIKVPLTTTDFSSYLRKLQDAKPDAAYMFFPVGPMSVGLVKAFYDAGLDKSGIQLLGGTETGEHELPAIGDTAVGAVTALPYGPFLDNPANKKFVAAYQKKYSKNELPSFVTVGAYDGMEILFRMLRETAAKRNGDAMIKAVGGYKWNSPTGPSSIDPQTREIIQNLYIRRVVKSSSGLLFNEKFDTIPQVKEPWHELGIGDKSKQSSKPK
jgi:branched-chain amino acid transport system substrate-binding protein